MIYVIVILSAIGTSFGFEFDMDLLSPIHLEVYSSDIRYGTCVAFASHCNRINEMEYNT
jgi:hypothetical protein